MSVHEQAIELDGFSDGVGRVPTRMTEEDFVEWCDEDVKSEWVDGEVIVMAPSSDGHVDFNGWLLTVLRGFVEHHDFGLVRGPELTVRLASLHRRRVPDLLFIAKGRTSIIKKNHVEGPPDLIVEIVSPDSESRDRREKFLDYEAAGVREYWIIDRVTNSMEVHMLDGSKYRQIPEADGKLTSVVLPGFYLRPEWVWQERLPKVMGVLKELGVVG